MATRVRVKTAACALIATWAASASVPTLALGLGELEMQSFLNEPLRAELELLDTRDLTADDIRIRLAGVEDFDRLGVDRSYFLTSIDFEVDLDPDSGRGTIRLSTDEAVLEPYLDLIVEARWPTGRILREYTVLVDPPAYRQEMISVSAAERVQAQSPDEPAVASASAPASRATQAQASDEIVAVRESSLPPGEMPDRAFSADTAGEPAAGKRYMVRRDETLWQIASRGRPEGVSVQQAMLDIQRVNPEAFIDGNINRIKAGYIIYLPSADEVSSDDLAAAIEEVREQNREFQAGRSAPGVSAAATLRVSADSSSRDANVDASAGAAAERSRAPEPDLATVEDAPAMGSSDTGATNTAVVADAETAAMNAELGRQLRDMSDRLDTLEQIVSLKDEQIATLEAALREAREEAAAARAQPAAPAPVAPAAPARTAPPAAAAGIPWLPIAGGLLVVVLAVVLLLRRRAAGAAGASLPLTSRGGDRDEDDVFAGVSLKREALDSDEEDTRQTDDEPSGGTLAGRIAAAEAAAVTGGTARTAKDFDRGGSRGYGERKHDDYIDEGSAGDALAEADIYIAYGRYMQAIELLDTAIAEEPANAAYRLKLIELYVDMGEEDNAAAQLDALREHGDADAIARGEALVGTGVAPSVSPAADELAPVDIPDPAEEIAASSALADDPVPVQGVDDDEVGLPDRDIPGEPAVDEAGRALVLDLDDDDAFESYGTDEPEKRRFTDEELAAEDDAVPSESDEVAPSSSRVAMDEPLEFDELEIEDDLPADDAGDGSLELDDTEDDLDFTHELMAADRGKASPAGDIDEDGDEDNGDDFLIAEDADQVATRLDLARAYLDMGDSEGARGILEDIADAGTGEQQREARALLERIG